MPTANEYEAWKAERRKADEQAAVGAANIVLGEAYQTDPDKHAQDLSLANAFSAPVALVAEEKSTFQQRLAEKRASTILSKSPRLAAWLADEPNNAKLAHDDLLALSWWDGPPPISGIGAPGEYLARYLLSTETGKAASTAAGNSLRRGGLRIKQGLAQYGAESAVGRLQDANKSLWEMGSEEFSAPGVKDPGMTVGSILSRYINSRLFPAIGIDDEADARKLVTKAAEISDQISAIPKSAAATRFQDAASGGEGADKGFGASVGRWLSAAGSDPLGAIAFGLETAGESAPQIGVAVAGSALTRNPAVGIGLMGGGSYLTERYISPAEFFKEKGLDLTKPADVDKLFADPALMKEAAERGTIRGAVIGAIDAISGGVAGRTLAKNPVVEAIAQGATQAVLGGAGEGLARLSAGQELDWNEVLAESFGELATTPVEMGIAGHEFMKARSAAEDAANRKVLFQTLSGQAVASKLRARMPERFRNFIAAATANGPIENVYVPADKFDEYFQSRDIDPFDVIDELPGISRQDYEAAVSTGVDLVIPTADYAAYLAGSDHDAFLMDHMRLAPDEMTSSEAADFNSKAQDALQDAYEEAERMRLEEEQFQSHEAEIYDTMVMRLREAGRAPDVARTEAHLYPAFYRAMGERSGHTTEELMRMFPLPSVRGDLPASLNPKNVDDFTRTLAEVRARKGRRSERSIRGNSLLDFVSGFGIKGDRGDVKAILSGRKSHRPGAKAIVRSEGVGLDEAAYRALEAGYLADDPVALQWKQAEIDGSQAPDLVPAFLDALARDASVKGGAEFVGNREADIDAERENMLDEVEQYLNRAGADLDKSDEEIRSILAAVQDEEGRQYGQRALDIQSDEFLKWFGNSQVVDPDGKPLLVYHGTKAGEKFEQFDRLKNKTAADFYFTPNKETAAVYGEPRAIYLKAEKLADIRPEEITIEMDKDLQKVFAELGEDYGYEDYETFLSDVTNGQMYQTHAGPGFQNAVIGELNALGYDGVRMVDAGFSGSSDESFIVFEPDQIKFADEVELGRSYDQGADDGWRAVNRQKADAWARSRGLQLPKDGPLKHQQDKKVLQHRDLFKGRGEGGKSYSQGKPPRPQDISAGPDGRTLLFDNMASAWRTNAERILRGDTIRSTLVLKENYVLTALNGNGRDISIHSKIAGKVREKHPDVPASVWRNLPSLIADPAYVFHRKDGTTNVVLDAVTAKGEPIIVAIRDNEIRTITPTHNNDDEAGSGRMKAEVRAAIADGRKVYVRDKRAFEGLFRLSADDNVRTQSQGIAAVGSAPQNFALQRPKKKILNRDEVIKKVGRIFYQSIQQADGSGARGSIAFPAAGIGQGETVINLFRSADLSTVLHESGHYFLTMYQALASAPNASEGVAADWNSVREWWRVNAASVAKDAAKASGLDVSESDVLAALDNGTTGDAGRDRAVDIGMQEQWARAFEAYLMEGKAPSAELRGAFERFRAWLLSIYKRLAGLGVNVSPEIKAVFDRMLATDKELSDARTAAGDAPMISAEDAAAMGLSEDEYQALAKLHDQARDEAAARLLKETMAPIKRAQEQWFKDERAKVRSEVENRLNAEPVYRAIEWLGNRRWLGDGQPETMPDMRFDRAMLVSRYGEGVLKTLPRGRFTVYAAEGGMDPDEVAGWFGFGSGDEMIRAMERAPKRAEAIEAETDVEMRDRHGDVLTDGRAEDEALAAVHGNKRGQLIAAELKTIARVTEGQEAALSYAEARELARRTIAGMKVRDAARPQRFLAVERKAAAEAQSITATLTREKLWMDATRRRARKSAAQIVKEGDTGVAALALNTKIEAANENTARFNELATKLAAAKRRQLINHALYNEARKVEEEVDAAEKLVAKLSKKSTREKLAGDYLEAIDEIIDGYDFRKLGPKAEVRRASLNAYIKRMTDEGRANELAIPDYVIAEAKRVPYKTLSVEYLRGVVDSLKNIEHTARLKQKLIDAKSQRDLDVVVGDITAAFDENVKAAPPGRVATRSEDLKSGVRRYFNLVLNASTLLREIDGREDFGKTYSNIKSPIDEASSRLAQRRAKAGEDFERLYSVYSKEDRRRMAVREFVPEIKSALSKWERIAVALNTGNEGNFQRLTDERVKGSFTPDQVDAIVASLDKRDWDFVQSVWDYLDSFRPEMEARERRVTGVTPEWVTPKSVETKVGTYRGGYYPLAYDPRLSAAVRDDQQQEIAAMVQGGRFAKAQTRNGHLKERAASSGRPVLLDMSVLHRHVNSVIYDLELSEPVSNAWRILQDARVRQAFINAGKQADFDALELWLKDVAEGEVRAANGAGALVRRFKSNFTAAKLAFNLTTAALQITGLAQAMVVLGKRDMFNGVFQMFKRGAFKTANDIRERSPFMGERFSTINKDIFDFYNDPKAGPVSSRWGEFKSKVIGPLSFWLFTKIQFHAVDVPTWIAAYEKSLRENGADEARALAYADDIVKRAHGSSMFSDRTAFERGSVDNRVRQSEFVRIFTTLGSYMFTKFNVAYERTRRAGENIDGLNAKSAQEVLSYTLDMAILFTLESLLAGAIKGQLPGMGDDDDDDESWMKYIASQTAASIFATLPFIRDVSSTVQGFNGGGAYGAITTDLGTPLVEASQGELDKGFVKSVVNASGLGLGLPAVQINRAVDATWRSMEGDDVSPMEFLLGRKKK